MAKRVFREYVTDDSFKKLIPKCVSEYQVSEYQVCLVFARDYNGEDSTHGNFIPYWDTEKVTPGVIIQFKKECRTKNINAKVVLSIGSYSKHFPFKISGTIDEWKQNAISSIQHIINEYHLDGIDIHYMNVSPSAKDSFVDCITELVQNIKGVEGKAVVSLTTNVETFPDYIHLYQYIKDIVETVVFEIFINIDHEHHVQSLVEEIKNKVNPYLSLPNILLGFSDISEDWTTVTPPRFFLILFSLLDRVVNGASLKVVANTNNFLPEWIPEMLSFAPGKVTP